MDLNLNLLGQVVLVNIAIVVGRLGGNFAILAYCLVRFLENIALLT